MKTTLDTKIEQATAAAAAQHELDEQAALAEQLPDLLAEKELERQLVEAEQNLAAVKARAKAELTEAATAATAWRERFAALAREAKALAEQLPRLQHQIFAPLQELSRACEQVNSVGFQAAHPQDAAFGSPGTSYAFERGRGASFDRLLSEVGGANPALSCWPPQPGGDPREISASTSEKLKRLIRRGGLVIYCPERGGANFIR